MGQREFLGTLKNLGISDALDLGNAEIDRDLSPEALRQKLLDFADRLMRKGEQFRTEYGDIPDSSWILRASGAPYVTLHCYRQVRAVDPSSVDYGFGSYGATPDVAVIVSTREYSDSQFVFNPSGTFIDVQINGSSVLSSRDFLVEPEELNIELARKALQSVEEFVADFEGARLHNEAAQHTSFPDRNT